MLNLKLNKDIVIGYFDTELYDIIYNKYNIKLSYFKYEYEFIKW